MNLGQFVLLVVILGAILAFVGVPWWMARRREAEGFKPSQAYLAAIDLLIRGDRAGATVPLRELAQHEAENLGAYLRLGDLVRRIGYADRAYRIHNDLLAREIEDPEDLRRVNESLLEDLLALDRLDEAKRVADRLHALDRKNRIALRATVRYHERRGDWEQALEILDRWHAIEPGRTDPTPAQMRIQMARIHLDSGRPREARRLLEEAVKMPKDGPLARVFLGDLAAQEGEPEKAAEEWIQYVKEYGYRSELVFARLERVYFEMGRFGDLVQVYEDLAAGRNGNLHAAIALADMHRRRGRLDESVRQLEVVLEQKPDHQGARRQLVGNLLQIGRTEQALRELDQLLGSAAEAPAGGTCQACGQASDDLWVRCEQCGAWQQPAKPVPPPRSRVVTVPPAD